MFLREVQIRNLRALTDLRLSFEDSRGDPRQWTLLLGENGCGKSTVLRAIALAFAGSDALPHLLGGDVDSWIQFEAAEAVVAARIETAEGEERHVELRLERGASLSKVFETNRDTLRELDAALHHASRNYLTVGYGASRRLNLDPDSPFKNRSRVPSRARAVATLFSPDAVLDPLESWVIDLDYQGKLNEGQAFIRKVADDLMPNVDFHGIDKVKKQLLFKTPDGIVPLTQLSDGYQNVAAWCGDLLRWLNSAFKNYKDPLQARGLLLIDEIDLHLHPVWQRRLRAFFDRTFPNLQFVATTHSALTVQQSGEGELYVLRREKKVPVLEAFVGAPNTMMIHQLLLSPMFDLESMDSLQVQKQRQKYRKLQKKPNRTVEENSKLLRLKRKLEELPDMTAGLAKHEAKQARVLKKLRAAMKK